MDDASFEICIVRLHDSFSIFPRFGKRHAVFNKTRDYIGLWTFRVKPKGSKWITVRRHRFVHYNLRLHVIYGSRRQHAVVSVKLVHSGGKLDSCFIQTILKNSCF